jgi:hypothetical protein
MYRRTQANGGKLSNVSEDTSKRRKTVECIGDAEHGRMYRRCGTLSEQDGVQAFLDENCEFAEEFRESSVALFHMYLEESGDSNDR